MALLAETSGVFGETAAGVTLGALREAVRRASSARRQRRPPRHRRRPQDAAARRRPPSARRGRPDADALLDAGRRCDCWVSPSSARADRPLEIVVCDCPASRLRDRAPRSMARPAHRAGLGAASPAGSVVRRSRSTSSAPTPCRATASAELRSLPGRDARGLRRAPTPSSRRRSASPPPEFDASEVGARAGDAPPAPRARRVREPPSRHRQGDIDLLIVRELVGGSTSARAACGRTARSSTRASIARARSSGSRGGIRARAWRAAGSRRSTRRTCSRRRGSGAASSRGRRRLPGRRARRHARRQRPRCSSQRP